MKTRSKKLALVQLQLLNHPILQIIVLTPPFLRPFLLLSHSPFTSHLLFTYICKRSIASLLACSLAQRSTSLGSDDDPHSLL